MAHVPGDSAFPPVKQDWDPKEIFISLGMRRLPIVHLKNPLAIVRA